MNYKKSIFVVMLLLSAVLLNACTQASAADLDDSQRYVNEKHGYSFEIPSDCTVGMMPTYCKASPPEERPQECLCVLVTENPDQVGLNAFMGNGNDLTLATFGVVHYDSPMFNPPDGADLVEWLEENLGIRGLDIPAEPNTTLGRIPAVRVDTAQSPQAFAYADIFFLKENLLFQISMLDTNNELNQDLYETLIASFEFTE